MTRPARPLPPRVVLLAAIGVLLLVLPAATCETVTPRLKATTDVPSAGKFPHERLGLLLEKVVTPDGLVDYATLSLEETLLEDYLAEVARVSPDSHRHLFPTEEDRLAYWINAHNACALRGVLRWNRPPSMASIAHRFDAETEFLVGGARLTLNGISNGIIRKRFADARVHFVLVKARRGGPPLSKAPFDARSLEEALTKAARAFVSEDRNVDWAAPSLQVRLSRLFLDFRSDFERTTPATVEGDIRLVQAINHWREPGRRIVATSAVPIPFDERLNDAGNR